MAATAMDVSVTDARLSEAKKYEYFSSINSMARKIMQEREKIKEKYGSAWEGMSPEEQDTAIDDGMMEPRIRARYTMHRTDREEVPCYPKMVIQTGQKIVHFGEEDITWQDEHSAPFSWETRSQMEFSVIGGTPEPASVSAVTESKPRTSQSGKLPGIEGSGSSRRDEESSFWKLNAERSRLEGEKADFQSLTPSQIKYLEKGEKPLPPYLRSDSGSREAQEPAGGRPGKPRVSKPLAPPPPAPVSLSPAPLSVPLAPLSVPLAPLSVPLAPLSAPPAALSAPPAPINVSPVPLSITPAPVVPLGGWERAQSTLPSVSSTLDDVFSPGLGTKTPSETTRDKVKEDETQIESPAFSQYNTSSAILKTGFDFLDNW
ncbi:uncharacterized protein C1orf198 homolog [Silurus meridionalis]|uniref:DUF4706 domain-containing protein n=1 Tax=Silurus meridionalis TaxID=175797 RepID=A0A8T0ARB7_SILME|nr:uncharacterized protein C1orf198 homolog [Silurus meridionalis]XP_046729705.1 uncharacterized protein C1orf198 homolog [Silurus meridionalis]XP_046729706.1 uncharacterized protein C1orf198 homolog [Silurus meridionalis]XP_046729707.1 uncharacterized protein C1orf198 homolog [Silurus meridionalis]XP_046729708.1 uncharacterized protein C1orf198 homolog [Silurus meridionalis]XP_046729709.1 uncharacterized protein C1orf198 homolog [Silurus meridionalis]XP_046729711.1 uncharacterized protein C1